jgi:hypothetical protein
VINMNISLWIFAFIAFCINASIIIKRDSIDQPKKETFFYKSFVSLWNLISPCIFWLTGTLGINNFLWIFALFTLGFNALIIKRRDLIDQ